MLRLIPLPMNPNPDDWRARITMLVGGAALGAMPVFAARPGSASDASRRRGWTVTVRSFRAPHTYWARGYRADLSRTTDGDRSSDPAEALSRALLAAATGSPR